MNKLSQFSYSQQVFRVLSFGSLLIFPLISSAGLGDGPFISNLQGLSGKGSGGGSASSSTVSAINMLGNWMGYPMPTGPSLPTGYSMSGTMTPPDNTQIQESWYAIATGYINLTPIVLSSGATVLSDTAPYTTLSNPNDVSTSTYSIINTTLAYDVWANYSTGGSTTTTGNSIAPITGVDLPEQTDFSAYPCNTVGCEIVYSILGTLDYTYCSPAYASASTATSFPYAPQTDNCALSQYDLSVANQFVFQSAQTANSDGTVQYGLSFPTPGTLSNYLQNQMSNIDANTLVGPLSYTSTQETDVNTFAHNLAASFIMSLPIPYSEYQTAYQNVQNTTPSVSIPAAQALFEYILNLKSFGSMLSVGLSDVDYIISRRMPNTLTNTSSAYNESIMATRRLFSTSPTTGSVPDNSWMEAMNEASPLVLQRESLFLLAEINYQLYLDRMQNERILLTLAAMQMGITQSMAGTVSQSLSSVSNSAG